MFESRATRQPCAVTGGEGVGVSHHLVGGLPVSTPSLVQTKRALLIGIDKYPRLNQLEGCVNDVQLMRSILQENFGFPPENVTLLADDQATRDAILAGFDTLVDQTGRDDIVVVHYAGHGSQITDREGD